MSAQSSKTSRPWKDWIGYFLPLLRPHWKQLGLALFAMLLYATFRFFRPWPLKVVIDRVLSHKPSRVPFIRAWLDSASFTRPEILYGACLATFVIAVVTGLLTYYYTHVMGQVGQRLVYDFRRNLFAHIQRLSLRFHHPRRTPHPTARLTSEEQPIHDMITNAVLTRGSRF